MINTNCVRGELSKRGLFWPGREVYKTPGDSDGWRTAATLRRYWTQGCVDCHPVGGNWRAPRTLKDTPGMETILTGQTKKKIKTKICKEEVKEVAAPPAASSSPPVDVGVTAGVVFTSASVLHLLTLPKVILAFRTWNRGISARKEIQQIGPHSRQKGHWNFGQSSTSKAIITYFNRKSWREFQGNKVSQTCKVWTGSSHEVNNRGHLLHQGEGMVLTHPQGTFKPSQGHNSDG